MTIDRDSFSEPVKYDIHSFSGCQLYELQQFYSYGRPIIYYKCVITYLIKFYNKMDESQVGISNGAPKHLDLCTVKKENR